MQDIPGVTTGAGARLVSAWAGAAVRPSDDAEVAVLLLDTRRGLVTYANPAALALTGARAQLPVEAAAWTTAARLMLPGARGDGSQALPVVDPVSVVAAGGVVPGMRLEIVDAVRACASGPPCEVWTGKSATMARMPAVPVAASSWDPVTQ